MPAYGQSDAPSQESAGLQKNDSSPQYSRAIEDNSFLIEEAYNQEEGVIQHISNAVYFKSPQEDLIYSFTQEWPAFGQQHQLSYTIPYQSFSSGATRGFGDILVNYRYQLLGKEDWAAFSPRISLIIPSGNVSTGLGNGSVGTQINLPLSKRISEAFVLHFNAGMTRLPNCKSVNAAGTELRSTLTSFNAGGSVIWLSSAKLNFMLEIVSNMSEYFAQDGDVEGSTETTVCPGLRYAIDIGTLQVVPGAGVPLIATSDQIRGGVLLYLSFEHSL
jgi:hypothetical protein